jgi:hypothetical protein
MASANWCNSSPTGAVRELRAAWTPLEGVIKSAAGDDVQLDAAWIRETWRSEPIADSPTKDERTSPEAELNARFIRLAAQLKNTTVALERLNDPVTPDGTALVDTIGLPPPHVTRLLGQPMDIQERLLILRLLGMQNAAETDDDETDGES